MSWANKVKPHLLQRFLHQFCPPLRECTTRIYERFKPSLMYSQIWLHIVFFLWALSLCVVWCTLHFLNTVAPLRSTVIYASHWFAVAVQFLAKTNPLACLLVQSLLYTQKAVAGPTAYNSNGYNSVYDFVIVGSLCPMNPTKIEIMRNHQCRLQSGFVRIGCPSHPPVHHYFPSKNM